MRRDFRGLWDDNWSAEGCGEHFRNNLTLKRLPSSMLKGYSSSWPDVLYSGRELAFQEQKPMSLKATPDAISRLEKALEWIMWVEISERRLIWWRAANRPWKVICCRLGCSRSTAWRKWYAACSKVARILNRLEKVMKNVMIAIVLYVSNSAL